jgi:hypothetical protein
MNRYARVRRSLFVVFAAIVLATGFASMQAARATPSDDLGQVLSTMRGLFSSDFHDLVHWAHNGTPRPDDPVFQPAKVEVQILDLDSDDRDAVLSWLRGYGRGELYTQGASDSDIGPPRNGIDASATPKPTPNPWRNIPLASNSLDPTPRGNIQILGGFAAVKKDGTATIVCVSFKNLDTRVANRVIFTFPLLDGNGDSLGALTLDRSGEFSPNINIDSFGSMQTWQAGGIGPTRSMMDGCVQRNLPTAALPLLQARTAGYKVVGVYYVDGSSWPAGSAPPPPPEQ